MSVKYIDSNGTIINASGLTPGGNLEAGAIAQRSGTKQITVSANSSIGVQITFSEPMPDADYDVNIEITDAPLSGAVGGLLIMPVNTRTKTANGFEIAAYNNTSSSLTVTVSYKAIKTYTVQHDIQNTEAITAIQQAIPAGTGSGNKLTTKSYVDNADNALDTKISNLEDLVPTGASITNQLVTASQASVDDALSDTSTHAVQNKVVKAALDDKDTTPTENSTKPITSGGVYNSEYDIWKVMGERSSKNFITFPYSTMTTTHRGITFTSNSDGAIDFEGTGDDSNPAVMNIQRYATYKLKAGTYTVSGGNSPYGGISLYFYDDNTGTNYTGTYEGLNTNASNQIFIWTTQNGYNFSSVSLYGYEKTFRIDSDAWLQVQARSTTASAPGTLVSGTIYPMIKLAEDKDSTFQPYSMTNQELTKEKVSYVVNNVVGSTNFVKYPFTHAFNSSNQHEYNGITYTDNKDGSITVNGTATEGNSYIILHRCGIGKSPMRLQNGQYIVSGVPDDAPSGCSIYVDRLISASGEGNYGTARPSQEFKFTVNGDYYNTDYAEVGCGIIIAGGTTVNNVVMRPMIRTAEMLDDSFVPYAATNQQLSYTNAIDISRFFGGVTAGATLLNSKAICIGNKLIKAQIKLKANQTLTADQPLVLVETQYMFARKELNGIIGNLVITSASTGNQTYYGGSIKDAFGGTNNQYYWFSAGQAINTNDIIEFNIEYWLD